MKKTLFLAAIVAPSMWAANASAQDCLTEADCADGAMCVFYEDCDGVTCPDDDPMCCAGTCEYLDEGMVDDFECDTDADCGEGWICEHGADEICSSWACAEGEPCPEPEVTCETFEYAYCVPDLIECATDADCPDSLECFTYEYEECSGGGSVACPPGEDCPEPDRGDVDCTSVSESFCAPAYIGPCEADADCGEGFACVEEQSCWCSGSGGGEDVPPPLPDDPDAPDAGSSGGGSSGSDAGSSDPGVPDGGGDDCGCEPTGAFYCEPQEIVCTDASECPADWSCESWGDSSVACTEDPETGEVICDEPTTSDESYCIPPEWGIWGAAGSGSYDDLAAEATGGESDRGGSLNPVPNTDDSDTTGDGSSDSRPSAGGCSAAPASGAGLSFLALLGLVGISRRRRA